MISFISNNTKLIVVSVLTALVTAGCGGGGGDSTSTPASPSAEGAYSGTLSGGTSSGFRMLILENGDYWALYGAESANQFLVEGFIQGQGVSSNSSFTSTNAKDFGVNPPANGSITASYVARSSIQGSATGGGQTVSFSGVSIPSTSFDYNTAASISNITGSWVLTSLEGTSVSLTVASGGSFTGTAQGCNFTGTLAPRPSGKNVYNLTLTFGAAPCGLPNSTGTGIALSYIVNGGARQLIIAGTDASRTDGTVLFGLR